MPIIVQVAPEANILTIYDNNTVLSSDTGAVNLSTKETPTRLYIEQGVTRIVTEQLRGYTGSQGIQGVAGVSVVSSVVDVNGHLILTLTDGTTIDAGYVVGPEGTGGTSTVSTGGIWITDITPTSLGIVASKNYDASTVPSNVVIDDAISDTPNIRVHIIATGDGIAPYTPNITIDGFPVTNLVEDANTKRYYTGYVDMAITTDHVITADNIQGGADTAIVYLAAAGPAVSNIQFGAYPNNQTELKNGDVINVSAIVENSAINASVLVFGANDSLTSFTLGAVDSSSVGFRTMSATLTVGSASGTQTIKIQAYNTLGTGGNILTSAPLTLNQTYPSFVFGGVAYPQGQQALKNTETATIDLTVSNFDIISYTSTDTSVNLTTTYEQLKTVTRANGAYVNSGTNVSVSATRSANGAISNYNLLVAISNVAPTADITITGSPSSLLSNAIGIDYAINILPSQSLLNEPDLFADKGTWLGAGFVNNSRLLRIDDSVIKGTGTFSALTVTSLSGIVGTIINTGSNYLVAGFQTKTITFAAFSQIAPIGTSVSNIANTRASYTGGSTLTLQSNTNNVALGYTIVDANGVYNANGDYLWISDAAFAGSNSSGTLQLDLQELAV